MNAGPACRDAWLESVLGHTAWRVDPDLAADACAMARAEGGPAFLFARLPTADTDKLGRLETLGFRVVDTTITLEAEAVTSRMPAVTVRSALPEDRDAVTALAGRSFRWSRFHLDPRFGKSVGDRIKAGWAGNFFNGARGSAMGVSTAEGGLITGFCLLLGPENGTVTIDLIAVDPEHRGLGAGGALLGWSAGQLSGTERVRAGTQAANIASLQLYERSGFRIRSTHYVLHHHMEAGMPC